MTDNQNYEADGLLHNRHTRMYNLSFLKNKESLKRKKRHSELLKIENSGEFPTTMVKNNCVVVI